MSILLFTVTVALFGKQSIVGATECYSCVNSTAVSKCSSVVSCKNGEICFADHITTPSGPSISLGCIPEGACSSIVPGSSGNVSIGGSLVGRSTSAGDCSECCRQNRCNRQLCQSSLIQQPQQQHQQNCSDGISIYCASVAEFLDVCLDHAHALQTCRKFCGLCSYADGSWSSWLEWSNCDVSCGNGTQSRIRKCTEPSPSGGGKDCSGTSNQTQICYTSPCPVHGHWSSWSSWGVCSASCSIGLQRRDRSCSNPYPSHYGEHCFGDSRDDKICMERACPETDGGWSLWSVWTVCSATCNTGLKTRQRQCSNPRPSSGGQDCDGSPMDVVLCNRQHCPRAKSSFTATKASVLTSGVLSFSNVLLNEGSNFNGGSGTFICQQPGLYFFTVLVSENGIGRNGIYCSIRHNASEIVWLRYTNPEDSTGKPTLNGYGVVTGSATLHLTNGDRVYVYCDPLQSSVFLSSFTGFLIAEDP